MNRNRRFLALALALCLVLTALSLGGCKKKQDAPEAQADTQADTQTASAAYAGKLFDTSRVHTVDVAISEADWADLCANPTKKTKYEADLTIDGEKISDVSFSTKGNTSMSAVAMSDSDRYSFKVNFGKYVDGQTYYGLNKLNLNNVYADASYMKDYLSYEIFRQAGVDAPLVSYVWLTVNGADHGLYIAIEDVSESWLDRTNGGRGQLYKPETEQLDNMGNAGKQPERPQGGDAGTDGESSDTPENGERPQMPQGDFQPPQNGERPEMPEGGQMPQMPQNGERPEMPEGGQMPQMPQNGERPEMPEGGFPGMPGQGDFQPPQDGEAPQMPGGGPGGFGGSAKGADLVYSDDSLESYSDIFDNCVTDAEDADKQRVVSALKALSEGKTDCLDTDEIIRYFAAHNFVLNGDSYTGIMLHNYYLMEDGGKLSMLPWDYNLAFGGFGMGGDATQLINTGIDTPLSAAQTSARPMWSWIAASEEYLQQYHAVYDELLKGYFESGKCEAQIEALRTMLAPYVEKDPSAFYTAEEFQTAVDTLKQFCALRAQSIRAQLDGTLAADTQAQDASKRVDASGLDVTTMGTHSGGGPEAKGDRGDRKEPNPAPAADNDPTTST